jgi:bifunctional UDP-N-acetylglucosamine pyrophosphorylase / glucosamine-1-phosphate N-acetyltransferase
MSRPGVGVVLAAGKGTRLKGDLPKVLHPVLGKPMIQRVLEGLELLGLERVILVIGHQAQQVETFVLGLELPLRVEFVVQEPQLGTGHALMQVLNVVPQSTDADVLITCGDMPLVPAGRYQDLLASHRGQQDAIVSMVKVSLADPTGYGRVVLDDQGRFIKIVEEKDATPEEKHISWANAGIYAAHWPLFSQYFSKLSQDNAQGEFYLTDVMAILNREHHPGSVATVTWPSEEEILGINSRHHLAQATEILSRWTANRLMDEGVTLINPASMVLAPEIRVGADTVFHPGCIMEGDVSIGHHCEIGPYTTMKGHIAVGNHCRVVHSFLDRAVTIGDGSYIGPYAHLRDNAMIGQQSRVGNFVEVKETRFGSRSNAAHLCYLGDADVGDDVNMGAGSIVANYDPIRDVKHRTAIQDGVKVGCNSVLVAPVILHQHSCVAAGSVITRDVSSWSLAVARSRQTEIEGWVGKVVGEKKGEGQNTSCQVP